MRVTTTGRLLVLLLAIRAGAACAEIGTTVPISAELGTSIAREEFPLAVDLKSSKLFLTNPTLVFINDRRIGIQVSFQAYDHRPAEGVAISETGYAQFSGELDYDAGARQVLLHQPKIDQLSFDRDNQDTRQLLSELRESWSEQVGDPLRAGFPHHPYLTPFKENIQNVSFDGESINLTIVYR